MLSTLLSSMLCDRKKIKIKKIQDTISTANCHAEKLALQYEKSLLGLTHGQAALKMQAMVQYLVKTPMLAAPHQACEDLQRTTLVALLIAGNLGEENLLEERQQSWAIVAKQALQFRDTKHTRSHYQKKNLRLLSSAATARAQSFSVGRHSKILPLYCPEKEF